MLKRKKEIQKVNSDVSQKSEDIFHNTISGSDELSQLCKSSQFLREMEVAMCECDSPVNIQTSSTSKSKINASCQCEYKNNESPDILVSNPTKWEQKSADFSISTQSISDSLLKDSYNTQNETKTQNKEHKTKLISLSLKKNTKKSSETNQSNIDNDLLNKSDSCLRESDQNKENVNCTIAKLMNSTNFLNEIDNIEPICTTTNINESQSIDLDSTVAKLINNNDYKRQVNAGFDNLETSIRFDKSVHEKTFGVSSNVTINDINWNESIMQSEINYPDSTNKTIAEEFHEIGPFYGLPERVKQLIKEIKGINELYDWQDECLRLESIKKRKNLVYSLPTSGGKTLVSEILMMREVLCRKKNALLVLPYVAIVQEKIWSFSPFAVSLDFLLEEYAAGKGQLPPRKRRFKHAVYIATIEKALSLINSLIEVDRLSEIGMVVVDELHLIGEEGRGAVLEALLTKILASDQKIQIVGMSATIGNLNEVCQFLRADNFTKDFRPVDLEEHVCCSGQLAINRKGELEPIGKAPNGGYTEPMNKIDPDKIGAFVKEVVPNGSCLLFCPTKKNCENVAILLTRVLPKELVHHKKEEKLNLIRQMKTETVMCEILYRTLPFGIAYHHSGLTMDERRLIEDAFRAGILCVICCTSTLAAGVNLPAQRVILRSPYVGRQFISLAQYKQMIGRAGRAGLSEVGQSILICEQRDIDKVRLLLNAPMDETVSKFYVNDWKGLKTLILSCISLNIANTRRGLQHIAAKTLMAVQENRMEISPKIATDQAITELFKQGALQAGEKNTINPDVSILMQTNPNNNLQKNTRQLIINNDTNLVISKLGKAAVKSGLDLEKARLLYEDLLEAQTSLVLLTGLHLLYLVTPYDLANQIKPSTVTYYNIYTKLSAKELQTAKVIGITESCALMMFSGRKITTISERVLNKFYLGLTLYSLWNETPVSNVAQRFELSRGLVQQLMTSSATFASSIVHFCEELDEFWPFADIFKSMTTRLHHCASRELLPLMELPNVKIGRAKQLFNAGFKTLQSIAKANPDDLVKNIDNLPRRVANQLVSTAKLLLLERVENLREEAEDVLEGITE